MEVTSLKTCCCNICLLVYNKESITSERSIFQLCKTIPQLCSEKFHNSLHSLCLCLQPPVQTAPSSSLISSPLWSPCNLPIHYHWYKIKRYKDKVMDGSFFSRFSQHSSYYSIRSNGKYKTVTGQEKKKFFKMEAMARLHLQGA